MKEFLVNIVYGLFIIIVVILGSISLFYKYATTDIDCWLARDPIICQKIKDSVK